MLIGIWISPAALGAIAFAILLGLRAPWWAVLAVVAACAALAVAAVVALMRWSDARAVRVWSQRPAQLRAERVTELPGAERPALEQHVHYHYHAADERPAIVIPGAIEQR